MMKCNACSKGRLSKTIYFELPSLPLVDKFESTMNASQDVVRKSIHIRACDTCKTLQITNIVDPAELYNDYIYESSSSPDLSEHFEGFATELITNSTINRNSKVLEIGINDGLLAKKIIKLLTPQLYDGIDPSPQAKQIQTEEINLVNSFFNLDSIRKLGSNSYDLIIANNVLSHIPNLDDALKLCASSLDANGILVFEVQSAISILQGLVFDYIYHEHIFYHTLESLDKLLEMCGLDIVDINTQPVKGGTYRVYAMRSDNPNINSYKNTSNIDYLRYYEGLFNSKDIQNWGSLRNYTLKVKESIHSFIINQKSLGKKIVGYGACATGTVLITHFDIGEEIDFIVDDNPKRQGRFSPGDAIPILDSSKLDTSCAVICLAWRHYTYYAENIKSLSHIIPLPLVKSFN